jgi:hypothetical protein
MAGDGVSVEATPVAWAPGQGIVRYPDASGVPLRADHRIIIQVHYNLADPRNIGQHDTTRVRFQLASQVDSVGVFSLPDPLLNSLRAAMPTTLPPGQASTKYTWTRSARDLGLPADADLKLYGIAPHMHERGRKYQLTISGEDGSPECAVAVARWDFHWQRMYFYSEPWSVSPNSQFSVTCDYDTSADAAPVKPGWGTRNEMCLAGLYFTMPLSQYEARLTD